MDVKYTAVYRGENAPRRTDVLWVHHSVKNDLTSPIVVQSFSKGRWVDAYDKEDQSDIERLTEQLGDITTLETTAQDSVVNAINEVVGNTGDLDDLTTTEKTTLVGAINEAATSGDPASLLYTAQTLTDEQKAQARTNMGAASEAELQALNSGEVVPVASLPTASVDTMGKVYLVGPDANSEYDRYVSSYDGTDYTWVQIGTTEMDLSGYATEEELSELELKVNEIEDVIPTESESVSGVIVALQNLPSMPSVSGASNYTFQGRNLVNSADYVYKKIYNDSGTEVSDPASSYFSTFIPAKGGGYISANAVIQRIYYYDVNKNWLGRGPGATAEQTRVIDSTYNGQTVGWIRIQVQIASIPQDGVMAVFGQAVPTTYEAYKANAGTEYYPDYTMIFADDLSNITVTVTEFSELQEKLVSGENIKTVNGQSILGGGNIDTSYEMGAEDVVLSGNIIVLEDTLSEPTLPASANVTGRNLVDGDDQVYRTIKNDSGTEISDYNSSYYTTFIPAIGGVTLSANVNIQRIYYYDVNKNWISRSYATTDSKTREVPATVNDTAVGWVQIQVPHAAIPAEGLMVNFGASVFAYEAYKTNNTPELYPGYSVVFADDLSTITISGKSLFMMVIPQISIPEVWEPSWVESGYSSPIGSLNTIRANWTAPNKYTYYDFLAYYYDTYLGGSYANKYKVTRRSLGNDCSNKGYEMFEYDFCPEKYTKVVLLSAGMNTNETSGIWGVATFIHELMNPAEPTMQFLHDNVRFIVLPIICPSSFDQTPLKYENYNDVRVNKNFNYKGSWDYIHNNYTGQKEGTYPDSEAETRNLKEWINKYSGIADFYIDCHSDDDSTGENYNTILTQVICSDAVIKTKIDATFSALVDFYTDKGYIPTGVTAKTQSWVEGGTVYPKTVYAKNFCQIPSIMIEQYICSTMYGSDGQTNNDTYGIKNYVTMLRMYVMAALVQNATAVPTGTIPMNGYRVNYK